MRKTILGLTAVVVSLLFAAQLLASSAESRIPQPTNPRPQIYTGEVTQIDLPGQKVVVGKPNLDQAMLFDARRATFENGYTGLSDLRLGDIVTVDYEVKGGGTTATRIHKGGETPALQPPPRPANHP
jgi:hypothetical protein